ncbi:MAG: class I SAM-dependent methyltransferase [Candidatus Heimdallarchaeota archaeon]
MCSGRGYLVEELARRLGQPVVATDFSPRVLQRDHQWLTFLGLYDRVSLLAFDARCTPFKEGAVETLTTNLGLSNVEDPGNLLQELRRIVAGTFLAISQFYPEDDEVNAKKIRETGLSMLLFRRTALECFVDAGWEVEVVNVCTGKAHPTPTGVVLEGAGIDAFPVAETMLEWCVLVAH